MDFPNRKNKNGAANRKRPIPFLCAAAWTAAIALSARFYADGILKGKFAAPPGIVHRSVETPFMTVNGEEIPVDCMYFTAESADNTKNSLGADFVLFTGKKDDRLFGIGVEIYSGNSKAGAVYLDPDVENEEDDRYDFIFYHSGRNVAYSRQDGHYYYEYTHKIENRKVMIGGYSSGEWIEIVSSGSAEDMRMSGQVFDFTVGGRIVFDPSGSNKWYDWYDKNKLFVSDAST